MASEGPIGAFDSGVGGLSIVAEIQRALPLEDVVFLGDTAHCPYGPRSEAEIRDLATAAVRVLAGRGAKLIVVACNTASVASLAHLRSTFSMPFVGIVPAVKPAAERTRTKRVGVIATNTTLRGRIFDELIERFASNVVVVRQVCQGLVELAEDGICEGPEVEATLRECLVPLVAEKIDTLVLGCTHYAYFRDVIQGIVGPDITVMDTAIPVARQVVRLMDAHDLRTTRSRAGQLTVLATGKALEFAAVVTKLTHVSCSAEHVDLCIGSL